MEVTAQLTVTDLAYGGDGVGHLNGKAMFVAGVLPDEVATVMVTEEKKRFSKGTCIDLVSPAAHRCNPACPVAKECPGCAYQHLEYEQELAWKHKQLCGLLMRIGKVDHVPDFKPVAAPAALAYRNKIVLHADGEGHLGYLGRDNRTVVDIQDCPLAVEPIRGAIRKFRAEQLPRLRAGDHVTFRWTHHDGVVSWVHQDAPQQSLTESVDGVAWQVPAVGFWQVNPAATSLLLETVRQMVDGCAYRYLMDLYCGAGLFALSLSQDGIHTLGVERDYGAIRAAKANARQQNKSDVKFVHGDASKVYPHAQEAVAPAETLVLVDPPRRGLEKQLLAQLTGAHGPRYVLYVSCAADTLARDCLSLATAYDIRSVQMVDMFPRTAHFETVVLFERRA